MAGRRPLCIENELYSAGVQTQWKDKREQLSWRAADDKKRQRQRSSTDIWQTGVLRLVQGHPMQLGFIMSVSPWSLSVESVQCRHTESISTSLRSRENEGRRRRRRARLTWQRTISCLTAYYLLTAGLQLVHEWVGEWVGHASPLIEDKKTLFCTFFGWLFPTKSHIAVCEALHCMNNRCYHKPSHSVVVLTDFMSEKNNKKRLYIQDHIFRSSISRWWAGFFVVYSQKNNLRSSTFLFMQSCLLATLYQSYISQQKRITLTSKVKVLKCESRSDQPNTPAESRLHLHVNDASDATSSSSSKVSLNQLCSPDNQGHKGMLPAPPTGASEA